MDAEIKKKIEQQIYKKYPEVSGSHAKVSTRPNDQYLLVFSGKGKTADGKTITHNIRVVVNDKGKIIKTTTSRG
ncbi:MAG: hypothetical protein JEZ00_13880 [Anaerolineaceae bacterium]|nr:hypothetical protein [Anaerolineaceae bacterium]